MDRLSATLSNLHASVAEGVGHFVHYEAPHRAAHEIAAFFEALSDGATIESVPCKMTDRRTGADRGLAKPRNFFVGR
jgi:hypothetical protein